MNDSLISRRYAKAIIEYATELGEEQALYESMRVLAQNFAAIPELTHTLANPMIATAEKQRLIQSAGGVGAQRSYDAFVRVVLDNRREKLILNIAMAYIRLYRSVNNISVISLTSARPMSHGVYARISQDITSRTRGTAEIEVHIDDSLGGGFILQINDLRLDASVRGQLEKIKRQMMNNTRNLV